MNILEQIMNQPDNEIRDDDHLKRKELSESEASEAFKLLAEKYKNIKPKNPKSNDLAIATLKALKAL